MKSTLPQKTASNHFSARRLVIFKVVGPRRCAAHDCAALVYVPGWQNPLHSDSGFGSRGQDLRSIWRLWMLYSFTEVFRRELDVINFRRQAIESGAVVKSRAAGSTEKAATPRPTGAIS